MSEGREDVDITAFEGNIVISLSIAGVSVQNRYLRKALRHNGFRTQCSTLIRSEGKNPSERLGPLLEHGL